jgi:nicotinate-nucleotide adenylyltransferase
VILFGGTFDPPHLGHVAVIQELRQQTGRQLVVVPTGIPGHRPPPVASPAERAEMVEIATRSLADGLVSVCRWEVEQPEPCFTIETVERWLEQRPEAAIDLALGSDVAAGLPSWRLAGQLMTQVRLLVFDRQGSRARGEEVLADLERHGFSVAGAELITTAAPAIEASTIRERLAGGQNCDAQLSSGVSEYIRTHHLYGAVAEAPTLPGEG